MKRMKKIFAKFVRILTAPPIFAALLCVFLYLLLPGSFASRFTSPLRWAFSPRCLFWPIPSPP